MDAYCILLIISLAVCGVWSQAPSSRRVIDRAAAAIANNDVEEANKPPLDCVTAKNVSGICVERQYCDYSTPAIDATLYATQDYIKLCKVKEVCCPHAFILEVEEKPKWSDNFDDDDDDDFF